MFHLPKFHLPKLGVGTGPFGNLYRESSEAACNDLVQQAMELGCHYFDTAPFYGLGLSESRVGNALKAYHRDDFVISTKVGRLLKPAEPSAERYGFINPMPNDFDFDYSYDGVMRSHEHSLKRLGLDRIDILLMHDLGKDTHGDNADHYFRQAVEGGYKALDELRSAGQIQGFGLGINEIAVCSEVMSHGFWDYFLLAGRYTLLEQGGLTDFLPACIQSGSKIILGGPYNSGILATGTQTSNVPYYNYEPAPEAIIQRVKKIEALCEQYKVSMVAAALQFPLGHPAVVSVIPGMGVAARMQKTWQQIHSLIPDAFWHALQQQGLIDAGAPLPKSPDQ
jgi:D-threo-aldose 1-dehydrogenase